MFAWHVFIQYLIYLTLCSDISMYPWQKLSCTVPITDKSHDSNALSKMIGFESSYLWLIFLFAIYAKISLYFNLGRIHTAVVIMPSKLLTLVVF